MKYLMERFAVAYVASLGVALFFAIPVRLGNPDYCNKTYYFDYVFLGVTKITCEVK